MIEIVGKSGQRRGAAILVVLLLSVFMFMTLATAVESYYQQHRQNQAALRRLQVQAAGIRLKRSPVAESAELGLPTQKILHAGR